MYSKDGKVVDRREHLKIKLKSLAAEAKIIRKEEKKVGTVRYVLVPERPRWDGKQSEGGEVVGVRPAYWRRVRMSINPLADEMYRHRIDVVRVEARATHIAYGLIKGRTIEQMEGTRHIPHGADSIRNQERDKRFWEKVHAMVAKYGPGPEKSPVAKAA